MLLAFAALFLFLFAGQSMAQKGEPESGTRVRQLQQAAKLIEARDFAAAESALRPLLDSQPGDPIALDLLGVIRMQQQNPAEAEALFKQAIASGHGIAGPHINLAVLYGADRPFEALAELQAALKLAPGDAQAESAVRKVAKDAALKAMRAGQKQHAVSILLKAREVLPHDPELLYEFGMAALDAALYRDAQQSLEEALKLKPDKNEAIYALARVYLAENMATAAEEEMRKYLAAKPEDASAQYGLGYILVAEQKIDEAKIAFEKSIALQPNQTESVFQLGEIDSEQGNRDAAREQFSKVLARDPRHAGALTGIAILAYREGKYDEAKTGFEQAIASAPFYQKAHYYYALTLAKLGNKTDADREFQIARSLQKSHGAQQALGAQSQ